MPCQCEGPSSPRQPPQVQQNTVLLVAVGRPAVWI